MESPRIEFVQNGLLPFLVRRVQHGETLRPAVGTDLQADAEILLAWSGWIRGNFARREFRSRRARWQGEVQSCDLIFVFCLQQTEVHFNAGDHWDWAVSFHARLETPCLDRFNGFLIETKSR